jgi:BirA family biotin operon repressor/biotin-[acetyl-CoA-carboxylase] ligase
VKFNPDKVWKISDFGSVPVNVLYYSALDSTNCQAVRLARENCADWTTVYAGQQLKGRGRYKRNWFSPAGLGLYFSVVLRPAVEIRFLNLLNLRAAWVMAQIIQDKLTDAKSPRIILKWPNDILINGKKVCGILLESEIIKQKLNYIVLGIGLNLNHSVKDFPADFRKRATSLKIESLKPWNPEALLYEFLCSFKEKIEQDRESNFRGVSADYQQMMGFIGEFAEINLNQQKIPGIIKGIDQNGYLLLQQGDQVKRISAGDLWL